MSKVEWWAAKVQGKYIDLWEPFSTRRAVERYIREDERLHGKSSFSIVKLTVTAEIVWRSF